MLSFQTTYVVIIKSLPLKVQNHDTTTKNKYSSVFYAVEFSHLSLTRFILLYWFDIAFTIRCDSELLPIRYIFAASGRLKHKNRLSAPTTWTLVGSNSVCIGLVLIFGCQRIRFEQAPENDVPLLSTWNWRESACSWCWTKEKRALLTVVLIRWGQMNVVAILYAVIVGFFVGQRKPAAGLIYLTLQHAWKGEKKNVEILAHLQTTENRAK